MLRKSLSRAAGFAAAIIVLTTIATAQTGQVEGTIKLKGADGTAKPVPGAAVEIYRRDVKAHFEAIKTDKNGHFVVFDVATANADAVRFLSTAAADSAPQIGQ